MTVLDTAYRELKLLNVSKKQPLKLLYMLIYVYCLVLHKRLKKKVHTFRRRGVGGIKTQAEG